MLNLVGATFIKNEFGFDCPATRPGDGMVAIVPDEPSGFIVAIVDLYCFCHAMIAFGDVIKQVDVDDITMVPASDVKNAAAVCRKFKTIEEALSALTGE